ncbi:MAG TPA: AMIN domain-containing protein, partial [Blastocatellia bacterium]|nr:AMIN domain-containing protein [Blastocatellia bacterium]
MFLGKSVRLIATVLLIAMACQITMAAGGSLESIYHTTSGERTTVILRGAATVPYVIHRVDDQTILIDLPGASANGLRPQYRVDSPAVESIEMEQVHTVSGESLTRMRVHLNTNCEVTPVVHDGLLTFNFMPRPKSYSPVPVSTSSASTGATVVTNVGAVMLTDSVVGFIDADGPVQYKHFATPDGKRVVVDIAGVHDVSTRKAVNVDGGVVKMVRVGQYSSVPPLVTRVVFEIAEPSAYTMQQDGNRLLVKFASTKPVVTAPPAPIAEVATQAGSQSQTSGTQSSSQTSSSQSSQTDDKKVPKLNRKTDDATKSDSNSAGTNPQQPTQQPSQITPPGTTPISGVSQEGASTVTNMKNGRTAAAGKDDSTGSGVKVTMDNPTLRPLPASRSNSVSTVNSQDSGSPDQTSGELKYGNPHFVGDPLSLNLNGVDIRQVTNLIAQQFGVNFIYDKSVGAVPVTVNNTEVPWNQVLDGLLKSQDLAATVEGPMVRILTSAKLIAEEEGKKRLKDSRLAALPLETKIVRLQYARADGSMAGASAGGGSATSGVSNSGSASPSGISGGGGSSMGSSGGFGGGMGGSGLRAIVSSRLSQRGKVEIDQRTNSLIITDVRENLDAALDMVAQLDRPERQVEIELRIVQANNDFQRDLG